MYGQFGQQGRQTAFPTNQPNRFVELQGGFHETVGDGFRYRIGNPDAERQGLDGLRVVQCREQFVADREYFFRVAQDAPPGIGQFQAAPAATEEFHSQAGVELAQLSAD